MPLPGKSGQVQDLGVVTVGTHEREFVFIFLAVIRERKRSRKKTIGPGSH